MESKAIFDYAYILVVFNQTSSLEFALDLFHNHFPKYFWSYFLCIIALVYLLYYLKVVVHKPRVISSSSDLRELLVKECSTLNRKYWPLLWAPQAHMQTVLRVLLQSYPRVKRRRELFHLSDGGQVYLDWCGEGTPDTGPVVIVLPGITGSFKENYIKHMANDAVGAGYTVVVFNYRGLGGAKLSTARLDCVGDCSDLKEVVQHVKQQKPSSNLVLVGTSMGGIQIVSYLSHCAETGEDPLVQCGLVISVPWQLQVAREEMKSDILNRLIVGSYVAWKLRGILKNNEEVFLKAEENGTATINYRSAVKLKSYEDIVERITCPMFGFRSCEEYISFASSHLKLSSIKTPLICLNSVDDFYCPHHALPEALFLKNSSIAIVTTKRGGHIGFLEGILPFGRTWMHRFVSECLHLFSKRPYQLNRFQS